MTFLSFTLNPPSPTPGSNQLSGPLTEASQEIADTSATQWRRHHAGEFQSEFAFAGAENVFS